MKTKCEARLSHLSPASPAKSSALQLINGSAIWNASVPWSNAWGESGAELGAGSPDGDLCEADPTAVQALPARLRFHSCTRAIAGSKRSREASMLLLCSLFSYLPVFPEILPRCPSRAVSIRSSLRCFFLQT